MFALPLRFGTETLLDGEATTADGQLVPSLATALDYRSVFRPCVPAVPSRPSHRALNTFGPEPVALDADTVRVVQALADVVTNTETMSTLRSS